MFINLTAHVKNCNHIGGKGYLAANEYRTAAHIDCNMRYLGKGKMRNGRNK